MPKLRWIELALSNGRSVTAVPSRWHVLEELVNCSWEGGDMSDRRKADLKATIEAMPYELRREWFDALVDATALFGERFLRRGDLAE